MHRLVKSGHCWKFLNGMRLFSAMRDARRECVSSALERVAKREKRVIESDPSLVRGFTLVEMLVVLLIVGMAATILFDAAAQVMNIQAHFGTQLTRLRDEAMPADWLRQLVEGLQPDYPNGKQIFKGSPRAMSGLTTNALSAGYGGLEAFSLVLQQDAARGETVLRYGTEKNAPELMRWTGDQGRFRYADAKGGLYDAWPPPLGSWPQLPTAIYLEGRRDAELWLIVAIPSGPSSPIPRPIDFMGLAR